MPNNKLPKTNVLNNTNKGRNSIKLTMYKGVLGGNIIEPPPIIVEPPIVIECIQNALDFSCAENSEYIGAI